MCGAIMWVLPQRTKETKKKHKEYQKDNTAVVKNVNTEASQKSKSRNQ